MPKWLRLFKSTPIKVDPPVVPPTRRFELFRDDLEPESELSISNVSGLGDESSSISTINGSDNVPFPSQLFVPHVYGLNTSEDEANFADSTSEQSQSSVIVLPIPPAARIQSPARTASTPVPNGPRPTAPPLSDPESTKVNNSDLLSTFKIPKPFPPPPPPRPSNNNIPTIGSNQRPQPPRTMASHPNIEMPKYNSLLSKTALRTFLYRFQSWAHSKSLTEPQAKFSLPLAFSSATAQNYFTIRYNDQIDPTVSFSQMANDFLTQCPMEADDPTSILVVLQQRQTEFEKASLYIQRIRSQIGDEYTTYPEPDVIHMMMDGLQPTLRTFLECKGPPTNYTDLVALIVHFEKRGLQKTLQGNYVTPAAIVPPPILPVIQPPIPVAPAPVSTIPIIPEPLAVNYVSSNDFKTLQAQITNLSKAMEKLSATGNNTKQETQNPNNQSQNQTENQNRNNYTRGNGRGNSNSNSGSRRPQCGYCGKLGHYTNDCYSKQRDESQNQSGYTHRGGNNSGYYGNNNYQGRQQNYRQDDYNSRQQIPPLIPNLGNGQHRAD